MERIRSLFTRSFLGEEAYAPISNDSANAEDVARFSWMEYSIFVVIGIAMLWAWNMFLAAAPYFQTRFEEDEWIQQNSQSAIISVSTVVNLISMFILTNKQSSANYPFRIKTALLLNICVFSLLTASTRLLLDSSAAGYLGFLLVMVGTSSSATGLFQNGAFSFAASFSRPEYTQAIMAGQGIAGILPPLAQMLSFLAVSVSPPSPSSAVTRDQASTSSRHPTQPGRAAFIYFLAAVAVSVLTLALFTPLVRRHDRIVEARMSARLTESMTSREAAGGAARHHISIACLFHKLHWLAGAVFVCFLVAMFFPVLTSRIMSVRPPGSAPLFSPGAFIPLAFFFWNLGDLAGRLSPSLVPFSLKHRPAALFAVGLARVGFLPLYLLCNIRGRGALVNSDLFYLLLVQFPFGFTTGWLGSNAMMAAGEWVDESEREAAGGFMGLCLTAGLTAGSLLSFSAAGI